MTLWHVLRTIPHQEAAAAGSVLRRSLALFFPRHFVTIRHARRTTSELRPLIPGVLFVRPVRPGDGWRESLRHLPGIPGLGEGEVIAVPERQMAAFRAEFDADGLLVASMPVVDDGSLKPVHVRPGDRAPIIGGPLADLVAEVTKVDGPKKVHVLIAMLGRLVEVQVPASSLGVPASPDPEAGARIPASAPA